jgi:hypothetical protein
MMGWVMVSVFMGILAKIVVYSRRKSERDLSSLTGTELWNKKNLWIILYLASASIVLLSLHFIWISLPWTR